MSMLHINHIICEGVHGVYEKERLKAQPFAVTLSLTFDATAAYASDELVDTIDYDKIRDCLLKETAETSFSLIEKLAAHLAEQIFSLEPNATEITLRIDKLAAWENGTPGFSTTFRAK